MTGVSGSLGGKIAEQLVKRDQIKGIRLTSRNVDNLKEYEQLGMEVARFDFDDKESMRLALKDCKTLLLISGTAAVGARILQHRAAIHAAKQAGVKRIVYTSYANPGLNSYFSYAEIHGDTEEQITQSGLRYSIIRNPMYMENLAPSVGAAAESSVLLAPGKDAKRTYLTKQDIAEITVNVLLNTLAIDEIYELTGSEIVTLDDIAAIASKELDKDITADDLSISEFVDKLVGFGLPPFAVTSIAGLAQAIRSEEYAYSNSVAEKLLGRSPTTIAEFINKTL